MLFPSLCIDNFFTNPYKVIEFSRKIPMHPCSYYGETWPGKRTEHIKKYNADLYEEISEKILSIFYNYQEIDYEINMMFQLIEPGLYGNNNTGWIHRDDSLASGVVYLSENIDESCGTSIYTPNTLNINQKILPLTNTKAEQYNCFNSDKENQYAQVLKEHNSFFKETVRFSNIFNRMVLFDGRCFHGVPTLTKTVSPRLTLVFFINKLFTNTFPANNLKQFSI
jgi:hypothetical protein